MATKKTKAPKKRPGRPSRLPDGERLERLTINLPPKLRYGLELLARAQHRSLSQAVEWALQVGLHQHEVDASIGSLGDVLDRAWDEQSEFKRLRALYYMSPTLLPFEDFVACELVERSQERTRLYDPLPGDPAMPDSDAPEVLLRSIEATHRESERVDIFYRFCEHLWPTIKQLASQRANAGKPTTNVPLLAALDLYPMLAALDFMTIMKGIVEGVSPGATVQPDEWRHWIACHKESFRAKPGRKLLPELLAEAANGSPEPPGTTRPTKRTTKS